MEGKRGMVRQGRGVSGFEAWGEEGGGRRGKKRGQGRLKEMEGSRGRKYRVEIRGREEGGIRVGG